MCRGGYRAVDAWSKPSQPMSPIGSSPFARWRSGTWTFGALGRDNTVFVPTHDSHLPCMHVQLDRCTPVYLNLSVKVGGVLFGFVFSFLGLHLRQQLTSCLYCAALVHTPSSRKITLVSSSIYIVTVCFCPPFAERLSAPRWHAVDELLRRTMTHTTHTHTQPTAGGNIVFVDDR